MSRKEQLKSWLSEMDLSDPDPEVEEWATELATLEETES